MRGFPGNLAGLWLLVRCPRNSLTRLCLAYTPTIAPWPGSGRPEYGRSAHPGLCAKTDTVAAAGLPRSVDLDLAQRPLAAPGRHRGLPVRGPGIALPPDTAPAGRQRGLLPLALPAEMRDGVEAFCR